MQPAVRTTLAVVASLSLLATTALSSLAASEDAQQDLQTRLSEFVGLVPGGAAAATVHDGRTSAAAAGIIDDRGNTVEPHTPFHVGFVGTTIDTIVALQLVDEGLVELDAAVHEYVPDAPVAADATVRQLLGMRVGIPDTYGQLLGMSMEDPGRSWTPAAIVEVVATGDHGAAGELLPSIGTAAVLSLLIEAVEGADRAAVLERRIIEPLGLSATAIVGSDMPLPPGIAQGWELGLGFVGDPDQETRAMRTLDPVVSTVPDLVAFLQALADGRLLSAESMALLFDEEALFYGMGFDTHDVVFGDLGELGTHYFPVFSGIASGYTSTLALDPASGNLVVVLTNSADLDATEFVRDIVSDWAQQES